MICAYCGRGRFLKRRQKQDVDTSLRSDAGATLTFRALPLPPRKYITAARSSLQTFIIEQHMMNSTRVFHFRPTGKQWQDPQWAAAFLPAIRLHISQYGRQFATVCARKETGIYSSAALSPFAHLVPPHTALQFCLFPSLHLCISSEWASDQTKTFIKVRSMELVAIYYGGREECSYERSIKKICKQIRLCQQSALDRVTSQTLNTSPEQKKLWFGVIFKSTTVWLFHLSATFFTEVHRGVSVGRL